MVAKISVIPVPSKPECVGKSGGAAAARRNDGATHGVGMRAIHLLGGVDTGIAVSVEGKVKDAMVFDRRKTRRHETVQGPTDDQLAGPERRDQFRPCPRPTLA